MMHRGLARLAVATGAVLAGAIIAATPAAATVDVPFPGIAVLDPVPVKAKDFGTKGCDGIPGGAKERTDGWVFSKPEGETEFYGYAFLMTGSSHETVVLGVDGDGAVGLTIDPAVFRGLRAGALNRDKVKSLAKATEEDDGTVAPPAGVQGGLTKGGEGWLQTPEGWQIEAGMLLSVPAVQDSTPPADETEGSAATVRTLPTPEFPTFSLLRVCLPKAEAPASAAPASPAPASPAPAPGTGGGNGASLPVTGTNAVVLTGAGVLLVAVGAGLFLMRRRRATKFVA
ncbi:LPXTG cell wall anchor domain-containing protein [Planosporangium flavigriseum]|uniref:LPXTG-motif cell wall anchor domain-containing protein n=1 Tax=Planosporangium flavigriseum TaxID=373681 RepID=A0A8J3LTG6_9ACTN|nr:LPXTG cell wall anchor domain-containing protein [Planosporangium flavigriseum]NJC66798.1 LPXTG cell wall anchor domain-containing protein [Planosporangium flavigriseum]GIG76288.1 hypothetical protein Pfl04_46920 [Planosporangium flavigriseum]